MLVGGRLVTGTGEVLDWAAEDHPELGRAARVSLGALGILTRLRLQLLPAYRLRRQEWCMPYELAMSRLDGLAAAYRNCDFYWYPRSDLIKIRLHDDPDRPFEPIAGARLVEDRCDWAPRIIAKNRELRFEEMEYALPAEAGPACFEEIRHRVKLVHRKTVGWRILYRFVAPDDAYLSTAHRRETVTISLLQNVGLPYEAYFGDIEPIFRRHGGRPHWGKKHSLAAPELAAIYPAWEAFHAVRRRFDPAGVFLSPALRRYFLEDAP
jgi:FAD/FMN-containing dehydrogenase